VRTLTNVYRIPYLKHNLISLGPLESNGCRYSAEGGVLTTSKGALVLIKGVRCGSLYILQGSTAVGSAAVTTSSKLDLTRLWYVRVGHVSEKDITILSKQGPFGSEGTSKLDFCDHCIFGKQKRVSVSIAKHRTKVS